MPGGVNSSVCNFCGVPGHFIRECEVVEEAIRFGKCKRNHEGKVVLPSGAMVPCSIPGALLCDCVDEYHRQNPRQLAMQMLFEVTAKQRATALADEEAGQAYVGYTAPKSLEARPTETYALKRPLPPRPEVVISTHPPHRRNRIDPSPSSSAVNSDKEPRCHTTELSPPTPEATPSAKKGKQVDFTPEPTHPYAAAPDATYSTPSE